MTLLGFKKCFLCVLGLSMQNSRGMRADVDLLTWQVLLGGLGSSVRAHRHLHLWAEHSGSPLGAPMRGGHPGQAGGFPGPPWCRSLVPACDRCNPIIKMLEKLVPLPSQVLIGASACLRVSGPW